MGSTSLYSQTRGHLLKFGGEKRMFGTAIRENDTNNGRGKHRIVSKRRRHNFQVTESDQIREHWAVNQAGSREKLGVRLLGQQANRGTCGLEGPKATRTEA